MSCALFKSDFLISDMQWKESWLAFRVRKVTEGFKHFWFSDAKSRSASMWRLTPLCLWQLISFIWAVNCYLGRNSEISASVLVNERWTYESRIRKRICCLPVFFTSFQNPIVCGRILTTRSKAIYLCIPVSCSAFLGSDPDPTRLLDHGRAFRRDEYNIVLDKKKRKKLHK